jgi:hypothetical protein
MNKSLGDAGLIFIRKNGTFVDLLCKLFNLEFNIIGIYQLTGNNLRFYLIDIFYLRSKTEWQSLSDVVAGCSKLGYKVLNSSSKEFGALFRSHKFESVNKVKNTLDLFEGKINAFISLNNFLRKLDSGLVEESLSEKFIYDSSLFNDLLLIDSIKSNSEWNYSVDGIYELFNNKHIVDLISQKIRSDSIQDFNILQLSNYINSTMSLKNQVSNLLLGDKVESEDLILSLDNINKDYNKMVTNIPRLGLSIVQKESIRSLKSSCFFGEKARKNLAKMKSLLTKINDAIESQDLIRIDYNELIDSFNDLGTVIDNNFTKLESIPADISYPALLINNDNTSPDIPILLKNGSKIYIPMGKNDYSVYMIEELEEMLIILDVYSSGNNKIDEIRAAITLELSRKIVKLKNSHDY